MKLELGWFYISIDREGVHIEIELRHYWFVLSGLRIEDLCM